MKILTPQELRTGNWIQRGWNELIACVPESRIWKPIQVTASYLQLIEYSNKHNRDEYRGIPLSEDILVKAGFDKSYEKFYGGWLSPIIGQRIYRMRVRKNENGFYFDLNSYIIRLYFVHQLQNGFHFLSEGEELNITL